MFKQSYRKTSKRRGSGMDETIAVLDRRLREQFSDSPRKRAKNSGNGESDEDMLSIPRKKACEEDTACASKPHMSLTAADLERTSEIATRIAANDYPEDLGAVHISADMWDYLQSIGIDAHRTLVQLVKEQLGMTQVCDGLKKFVTIQFSRSAYVSAIGTPTAKNVTADNEVEVPDTNNRYLQRIFATDNFYATGRPKYESVILQAGYGKTNGVEMNKLWFGKALGILSIQYKPMLRPNSEKCVRHNKDK